MLTVGVGASVVAVLLTSGNTAGALPAVVSFAVVGFVTLLQLSVHLVIMLFYGAKANAAAGEHAAQLLCRQAEARQALAAAEAAGDGHAAAAAAATVAMLDTARHLVLADADLEPVRILGLPATSGLMKTLAAGAASAASAIIAVARNLYAGRVG